MSVMNDIKDMGLAISDSGDLATAKIDFAVVDGKDKVAWVWGTLDDYEVECDHAVVEYDDDETVGECLVCGATCDWHWECYVDCGYTQKSQVPHHWNAYHEGNGGIIEKYIEEVYGTRKAVGKN